jgi:DNA-binding transcriptional MerR regulator/methylmalonyl-CoA mutase cobalamin-binding subunit
LSILLPLATPIKVVAQKTGLSQHVIRIWEKRYQAVVPTRTPTGRRIYSDDDVRRLMLLRDATRIGHPIGMIAKLNDESLEKLVAPETSLRFPATAATPTESLASLSHETRLIEACVEAVKLFDGDSLNQLLDQAAVEFGYNGMLRRIIAPLAQRMGDLWGLGALKTSHEHFASSAIRAFILNPARQYAGSLAAPAIIVSTPQGQLHEMGAVLVAALASEQGWRAIYLGPSLPAAEIAGAAVQDQARAIALSIIYPEDDPNIDRELSDLRRLVGTGVSIMVGGRAAERYRQTIEATQGLLISDLAQLQMELARIRSTR